MIPSSDDLMRQRLGLPATSTRFDPSAQDNLANAYRNVGGWTTPQSLLGKAIVGEQPQDAPPTREQAAEQVEAFMAGLRQQQQAASGQGGFAPRGSQPLPMETPTVSSEQTMGDKAKSYRANYGPVAPVNPRPSFSLTKPQNSVSEAMLMQTYPHINQTQARQMLDTYKWLQEQKGQAFNPTAGTFQAHIGGSAKGPAYAGDAQPGAGLGLKTIEGIEAARAKAFSDNDDVQAYQDFKSKVQALEDETGIRMQMPGLQTTFGAEYDLPKFSDEQVARANANRQESALSKAIRQQTVSNDARARKFGMNPLVYEQAGLSNQAAMMEMDRQRADQNFQQQAMLEELKNRRLMQETMMQQQFGQGNWQREDAAMLAKREEMQAIDQQLSDLRKSDAWRIHRDPQALEAEKELLTRQKNAEAFHNQRLNRIGGIGQPPNGSPSAPPGTPPVAPQTSTDEGYVPSPLAQAMGPEAVDHVRSQEALKVVADGGGIDEFFKAAGPNPSPALLTKAAEAGKWTQEQIRSAMFRRQWIDNNKNSTLGKINSALGMAILGPAGVTARVRRGGDDFNEDFYNSWYNVGAPELGQMIGDPTADDVYAAWRKRNGQ